MVSPIATTNTHVESSCPAPAIGVTPAIARSFAISSCVGMPEHRNTSSSARARACSRPTSGGAGATAGISGTGVIVAEARGP